MPTPTEFQQLLRHLQGGKNVSEFAEDANVHRVTMSRMLNNADHNPDTSTLRRITVRYNLPDGVLTHVLAGDMTAEQAIATVSVEDSRGDRLQKLESDMYRLQQRLEGVEQVLQSALDELEGR